MWKEAYEKEGRKPVTIYCGVNVKEDFAESLKLYMQENESFRVIHPIRTRIIEEVLAQIDSDFNSKNGNVTSKMKLHLHKLMKVML